MKTLAREFTPRERVLLLILSLIIVALAYYILVDSPVRSGIKNTRLEIESLQLQEAAVQRQIENIRSWESELERLKEMGRQESRMPSYNSSKEELDFLNATLAETLDYYVGFTQITREGDQIRRSFALNFSAVSYNDAVRVLTELENSSIRCLIGDFSVSPYDNSASLTEGPVTVNVTATFYETMFGGKEDKELPPDTAPQPAEAGSGT